jgi:hypothetical protein
LFASSVVAPDPDDNDDDAASTATTTMAHGLLPPGLGVTLSLRHFALLLVVIDVVVVVSALPANDPASVSLWFPGINGDDDCGA